VEGTVSETPKNRAGQLTEIIMLNFNGMNPHCIIDLETDKYNRVYEHIYRVIHGEIGDAPERQRGRRSND
jgi:hypothetical protein